MGLQEKLTRREFLTIAGLATGAVVTGCAASARAQESSQYKVYLPHVVKSGEPVSTPTPRPTETPDPDEPLTLNYANILLMPTWTTFQGVYRFGSEQLKIYSPSGASEVRIINRTDYIVVGNRGCEAIVDMNAFGQADGNPRSPGIMIVNRYSAGEVWLRVGFDSERNLDVYYFDQINQQGGRLIDPSLRLNVSSRQIKLESQGFGDSEVFNFYDYGNGNPIPLKTGLKLPRPFFTKNVTRLYFGFHPQAFDLDGVVMDAYQFKAKSY